MDFRGRASPWRLLKPQDTLLSSPSFLRQELKMSLVSGSEFRPHEGQWRAWNSDKRFIAMLAGTQGGKTSFLPFWLAREIAARGSGDYLAITTSFDLFKLKLLPEMRFVFEDYLRIGKYWAAQRVIEIADPRGYFWAKTSDDRMYARIILRSVQSKGGLEASTAKGAIFDEAGQDEASLEDWEAIVRRLSLNEGRILIGTTLYNLGWLKTEIYDPWEQGDEDIEVIQFPSIVNPAFPEKEFERVKSKMQDWRFRMFYLGEYSIPPSMIYGCVAPMHWEKSFDVPFDWRTVVGVDPSGGHCATLWLAENPGTKVWHIYRETLDHGNTTRENVNDVKAYILPKQKVEFIGGGPSEEQERRDWHDNGVELQAPGITSVEAGIDRAVGLFKQNKLRVFDDLRLLKDELGSYRRKIDENGTPLSDIVDKRKYHLLDCLRHAATLIEEPEEMSGRGSTNQWR